MNNFIKISILMLLLALLHMPYGYYQLLRLVITIQTFYIGYSLFQKDSQINNQIIYWGLILLIYNPVFKISFSREIWIIVNIVTIISLIIKLQTNKEKTIQSNWTRYFLIFPCHFFSFFMSLYICRFCQILAKFLPLKNKAFYRITS